MRSAFFPTLILLLTLAACSVEPAVVLEASSSAASAAQQQQSLDDFFAAFTDEWVAMDPDLAIGSGYFTGAQQDLLERQLTPVTREFRLQQHALARRGLARLQDFELAEVPAAQRIAADVMRTQLQAYIDEEPWLDYILFPLDQMIGANAELPSQLTVVHPLDSAADAETYLQRLQLVATRMQEATRESARRAALGILPPAFILQTTIDQMERFSRQPAARNPLISTLAENTTRMSDLDPQRRIALLQQAEQVVTDEVYPAWQAAIATLRAQLPQATNAAGLWRFAVGADIYANQLKVYTTTDLSADAIHAIGLAEVARIEAEMERLLRELGLEEGSLVERVDQLSARLAWPATATGRADTMAFIDATLADALERSALLFDTVPRSAVIAQPYPEFLWNDAAASYTPPPLDGSRPGVFQMPLRASRLTRFALRTLVYHETVPGHHFQIALTAEDPAQPRFMQMSAFGFLSASGEGWALYAERLAAESGWYEGDPEGLIGQLDSALFRAKRLVVDTGIHAKGWTRQQAIDYGIEPSEVDRYIVWPGQACSYMIGQLKLVELRERARTTLGDRFSIRDYHKVVLGAGSVPLSLLEQLVDAWIAATLAAA